MKQKSSIYNNSYKIGLIIFVVGVLVTSLIVVGLYNFVSPSIKITSKKNEPIFYNESITDTIYIPKIETRVVHDTIKVYCKKKHCDEVHVATDTTKS